MARVSKLQLAKSKIEKYFDAQRKHVFSYADIEAILKQKSDEWDLGSNMTPKRFVAFFVERSHLSYKEVERYIWREEKYPHLIYEIAVSLRPRSYISHYTAMFLHGLTEQIPKTIYVTFERRHKATVLSRELSQMRIDRAFQKEERRSSAKVICDGYQIVFIESGQDNHVGVLPYEFEDGIVVPVTNVERLLIDGIVRPGYSGGVPEVLKAYQNVVDIAQVSKIKAYLKKLDFIYPYAQAVGFCLEYAKFSEKQLEIIEEICPKVFKFYLTRQMQRTKYSPRWMLYYPSALE